MERLTTRDTEGTYFIAPIGNTLSIQVLINRLADYEDAEEQGLLVRVVRCRDCKYYDPEDMKCDCGGLARIGCDFALDANYFCAYGELREEAKTARTKED